MHVRSKELCFALPLPDIVFLSSGATFESKKLYTMLAKPL